MTSNGSVPSLRPARSPLPGPLAPEARCSLPRGTLPARSGCPRLPSKPLSYLSNARSRFLGPHGGAGRRGCPPPASLRSTCGDGPEPARPNLSGQASTRTTRTQTPKTLYTRDIPRKKHLIHPLNNSDNSVLSPIYMFQTRYRCYENIANIQKYIHLKRKTNETETNHHINYLQYT